MIINGKAGHKQVAHAERVFVSGRISNASARRSMFRELRAADSSVTKSYAIGLRQFNLAVRRLKLANTLSQKEKAKTEFQKIKQALDVLDARRAKIKALVGKIPR